MVSGSLPQRKRRNRLITFVLIFYYIFESIALFFIPHQLRRKNIKGQIVLVTGSGSGIGQLMAVKFAVLGCKVVLWDIDESGMKETLRMMKAKKLDPRKISFYKVDLADRVAIYETAKKVKVDVGVVDILVNNAGVVTGKHFLDSSDEKIQATFNVNTMAHFYTTKCFLPDMIKQKYGHIVTVASAAGHLAAPKVVDYCASKFANVGFDLALRMELAQTNMDRFIKTTIVKPYLISTGMFHGVDSGIFPYLDANYVADRVIAGVLVNAKEVILPYYLVLFFWLTQALPTKALIAVMELAGGMNAMTNFSGRDDEAARLLSDEINNNSNNSNNNNNFINSNGSNSSLNMNKMN